MSSSVFESLPGAVGSPPQHYGNPLAEQKALAEGRAVVDLGHRGVVTVSGPDRLTWPACWPEAKSRASSPAGW